MNNESYMTSEDTTSMLVDRFASREDIDPRFQTLSVPPFPRPLPPPPPRSFLFPLPYQGIIPECQEWDVKIKQLKLAPKTYIFFMH